VETKGWLCVNGHVRWCVLQEGRLQIHGCTDIPDFAGSDEDFDVGRLISGANPDVAPPPFIVDSDIRNLSISPVPFELPAAAHPTGPDAAAHQPLAFELVVVNADHTTTRHLLYSNLVESNAVPELACQRGSFPADVRAWHQQLGRVGTATHSHSVGSITIGTRSEASSIGMGVM
jgi:hypothetical protein